MFTHLFMLIAYLFSNTGETMAANNLLFLAQTYLPNKETNSSCQLLIVGFDSETSQRLAEDAKDSTITILGQSMSYQQALLHGQSLHDNAFCVVALVNVVNVTDIDQIELILKKVSRKQVILLAEEKEVFNTFREGLKVANPTWIVHGHGDGFLMHLACPDYPGADNNALLRPQDGFIWPYRKPLVCPHPYFGKHFNLSASGLIPYMIPGPKITGVDINLTRILARKFKFTFSVEFTEQLGKRIPGTDNKWSGVIGMVANGTCAFGIGNIALEPGRFTAVDFTTWTYTMEIKFMSPRPKQTPPYQNIFHPFSSTVWTLVIASTVSVTLLMVWAVVVTRGLDIERNAKTTDMISMAVLFPYGSLLLQQDFAKVSKLMENPALKIMILFWSVFTLLITFAYNCNFRAYLMDKSYDKAIDSAQDIIDMNFNFHLSANGATTEGLKNSPIKIHKELYRRGTQGGKALFTTENGWLKPDFEKDLLNNRGVTAYPKEVVLMRFDKFYAQYGRMPYHLSKEALFFYYIGIVFPKFSPVKKDFDRVLSTLVERGIVSKIIQGYYPRKLNLMEKTHHKQEDGLQKLAVGHLLTAYLILAGGIMAAGVAFLFETGCVGTGVRALLLALRND